MEVLLTTTAGTTRKKYRNVLCYFTIVLHLEKKKILDHSLFEDPALAPLDQRPGTNDFPAPPTWPGSGRSAPTACSPELLHMVATVRRPGKRLQYRNKEEWGQCAYGSKRNTAYI
ncbi:hypothetical protein CHARACLAT_008910 [Characodon lateralis]|uniref:Uncharacterized protein n=1 Tax=Characodon lateralis TaxID=208331 RepID=A0ABU7DPP4_9TELE|nr:hypothetical protein [Characodon lateralis]